VTPDTGAGHTDAVRALATSDDRLFSGSYDGTVKVWDVVTLECLKTLAGHTGPVRTLVSSGGHMFSGSYDKTVRFCLPRVYQGGRSDLSGLASWMSAFPSTRSTL
jgi:WD40 repeat protein